MIFSSIYVPHPGPNSSILGHRKPIHQPCQPYQTTSDRFLFLYELSVPAVPCVHSTTILFSLSLHDSLQQMRTPSLVPLNFHWNLINFLKELFSVSLAFINIISVIIASTHCLKEESFPSNNIEYMLLCYQAKNK